ncbi:MAG: LysE family translocator [Ignavibacteria bacterium]|nr:LysE family translocator [Ignavibacteria bacterium]
MWINLIGFITFAFTGSITPGPNNLTLFSYGRTNNFRQSLHLMAGIMFGVFCMLYLAGYGIAQLITANKYIEILLKIVGTVWLIYLGFLLSKINPFDENTEARMISFKEAFLMQFINPKAWLMAIVSAGAFMPDFSNIHLNVFVFSLTFCAVGIPCMLIWLKMSKVVFFVFKNEKSNKFLSHIIFALMILSAASIWIK